MKAASVRDSIRRGWQQFVQVPQVAQELSARNCLLVSVLLLITLGTVMIGSASMPYAAHTFGQPMYFLWRQGFYLVAAAITALVVSRIPLRLWFGQTFALWLLVLGLLAAVLVVGNSVNGSKRWLMLAGVTFQPSELAKFVMVLFTADYVVRRANEVRVNLSGLLRLLIPMGTVLLLIMLEPDLGASTVVVTSMMAVFFLAGAPLGQFGFLMVTALGALVMAILFEPYRLQRLVSFTNPWDDEQGTDYQLKQGLIAFGRGEWTGTGLGHSVQKLSYLPEAHTDFMLAIVGEELGFLGICALFGLLFVMVSSAMRIGRTALQNGHDREGYLAYGITVIFLLQILVNGGMNMGLLPTKGLTLPFISYGGTSLVVCSLMVAVLLRIDRETRQRAPRSARAAYDGD